MSYMLVCEDVPSTDSTGAVWCGDTGTEWYTQVATTPFDTSQIDATTATYLFGSGMFLCIGPVSAAFGASMLLNAIRGRK